MARFPKFPKFPRFPKFPKFPKGKLAGIAAGLAIIAVIGAACGGGGSTTSGPANGPFKRAAPSFAGQGAAGSGQDLSAQAPQVTPRIIKTGAISLQLRPGTFDRVFQQATFVASRAGGFVSTTETSDGRFRSGTLVLRVPASQFETVLGQLRSLGRVRGQRISGEDVTSRFVDLGARLKNWRAQEAVLLRLMGQSTSVGDSLKVEGELQNVQQQIEEIQGELRVLSDQTAMATISLSLTEMPSPAAHPKATFLRAWSGAVHGLGQIASALIVGLGYALPFGLVALALLLGWLGIRRLRPRAAAAS
jgi:hypothetical protein